MTDTAEHSENWAHAPTAQHCPSLSTGIAMSTPLPAALLQYTNTGMAACARGAYRCMCDRGPPSCEYSSIEFHAINFEYCTGTSSTRPSTSCADSALKNALIKKNS